MTEIELRRESTAKILVLGRCQELTSLLATSGYAFEMVGDPLLAMAQDELQPSDMTILDIDGVPSDAGLKVCERLTRDAPDTPVVVVSEPARIRAAVGAIRSGAFDILCKPLEEASVDRAIHRALDHHKMRTTLHGLAFAVEPSGEADGFVGYSPAMRAMYTEITKAARADTSVLIRGESGSGKELVARAIHQRTNRRDRPFVAINCAAIQPALLESELFGHVAGAFTGAQKAREGVFVAAEGGTLLLDEIGDMPAEMQAKLLRVLQEHHVRPVGGNRPRPFDVRVLAATNCDLKALVEQGRFRLDLYYRINGIQVVVPPLRSRGADVLRLADHYLILSAARLGKPAKNVSAECARALLLYSWPGNVRELQNVIERAVALSTRETLELGDLPKHIAVSAHADVHDHEDMRIPALQEIRTKYILHVIDAVGGNRTRAADILHLNRRTLYRYLERARTEGT